MWQADDADSKFACSACPVFQRYTVFLIDPQRLHEGHDSQAWTSRPPFEPFRSVPEQPHITSKPVDKESANDVAFIVFQHIESANNRGKHTAAIDIGYQQRSRSDGFRERKVYDVPIPEIDLCSAARAFEKNDVKTGCQTTETCQSFGKKEWFLFVILGRAHRLINASVENHLNPPVAGWLKQNRIHIRFRLEARSFGLRDLGAADFAAVA